MENTEKLYYKHVRVVLLSHRIALDITCFLFLTVSFLIHYSASDIPFLKVPHFDV